MNQEEYVDKKRRRVGEVAKAMLYGSVDYLEGAIELSSLRFEVEAPEDDPDFIKFVAIASEVDHLPIGPVRQYWSSEALQRHEHEIQESIEWAKNLSLTHCMALSERYGV